MGDVDDSSSIYSVHQQSEGAFYAVLDQQHLALFAAEAFI